MTGVLLVLAGLVFAAPLQARQEPAPRPEFAGLVERLSEAGGAFDSDNLISNETSYLHVLGAMRRIGVSGGAYIGVGPDQNFSYLAAVRPEVAYLIDIRRDNLLLHLAFKAIFAAAPTRIEYLALLLGRSPPPETEGWTGRTIDELVTWAGSTPATEASAGQTVATVRNGVRSFGVAVTQEDLETIERFHREFITQGIGLQFTSFRRGPRPWYPTFGELLSERDLGSQQASYLASEEDYAWLRRMQAEDRVVPVVGSLAGPHALAAIGEDIRRRRLAVSMIYASNVEFYLWMGGTFDRFAKTVSRLPRDRRSVIVRSYFGRGASHPLAAPGYFSTQLLQTMDAFVAGLEGPGYQTYWDLVTRDVVKP
jgi:hypothetical protein